MKGKKIAALLTAVAVSVCGSTTAFAYVSRDSWSINYGSGVPGAYSNQIDDCKISTYGEGYQTYCSNIKGSNDVYVRVTAPGVAGFNITQTGLSAVHRGSGIGSSEITFRFTAGTSYCVADGTVGYNM